MGVHDNCAGIADRVLASFADMEEAWKASKEWCEVLENIRKGELRDEEVLATDKKTFYEKAHKWRAFKDNEDRIGMCKAADYHDTWFITEVAAVNVNYICRAGGAWPCRLVTLSSWWQEKHTDPLATKQKWYCPAFEARSQTKWGWRSCRWW